MKTWKFISRSTNYRVTLKHGIPAEPLTGRNATPGIYAKFEDGILTTTDEEMAGMLTKHAGYGSDYLLSEDSEGKDPFLRNNIGEPDHDITEIEHGSIGKSLNPKSKIKITPETKKAIEEMANNMAKEKFAELVNSFVKEKKEELADLTPEEVVEEKPETDNVKKSKAKAKTKK